MSSLKALLGFLVCITAACGPDDGQTCELKDNRIGDRCENDNDCGSVLQCVESVCEPPPTFGRNSDGATITITRDSDEVERFSVEVADTIDRRERGLSQRRCFAGGWSMLLDFEQELQPEITMRNVSSPLTLIFFDESKTAHSVQNATAGSDVIYTAMNGTRYVLEVVGDSQAAVGDRFRLSN